MMTSKTTVVVVDTHKPEMVLDENVLNKANRKVVIDHHRRGESFISNPLLVYMEPYASSTAELVTELLEYQPTEQRLTLFRINCHVCRYYSRYKKLYVKNRFQNI